MHVGESEDMHPERWSLPTLLSADLISDEPHAQVRVTSDLANSLYFGIRAQAFDYCLDASTELGALVARYARKNRELR